MEAINKLNELIEENIKLGAFPGANYTIVFKDKAIFGSLGNMQTIPFEKVNHLDTIYDMASLTKVVCTTSCIMKLLEEGKIRLNQKVKSILPLFKHEFVSIYHLLTHTSGLPEGLRGIINYKSKEEIVNAIYNSDLMFESGSMIKYSDLGFVLLGEIVEHITNMSLDEYSKFVLFEPLEMTNTGFNPKNKEKCAPTELRDDVICKGIVQGYVHDETSYISGGVLGHAGLFSTVQDVSNFIQMILNEGTFEGKEVFKKSTINRLFKKEVSETHGCINTEIIRGLGWLISGQYGPNGDFTSSETIHHTGFTGTSIFIDRINEVGFCLLTNRVHPTRNNILHMDARSKIANYVMSHLDDFK